MDDPRLSSQIDAGTETIHDACGVYDGTRSCTFVFVHASTLVFLPQLPELMLLRGMHDSGCDEIFIIVTDLKRQEMDDVTEYFKLVCRHSFGRSCKPSMERKIQYDRE